MTEPILYKVHINTVLYVLFRPVIGAGTSIPRQICRLLSDQANTWVLDLYAPTSIMKKADLQVEEVKEGDKMEGGWDDTSTVINDQDTDISLIDVWPSSQRTEKRHALQKLTPRERELWGLPDPRDL